MNQLTKRQREVAELVAHGFTNRAIAERLFISEQGVRIHVHRIYTAMGYEHERGVQRVNLALDYWRSYGT